MPAIGAVASGSSFGLGYVFGFCEIEWMGKKAVVGWQINIGTGHIRHLADWRLGLRLAGIDVLSVADSVYVLDPGDGS